MTSWLGTVDAFIVLLLPEVPTIIRKRFARVSPYPGPLCG